MSSDPAPARFIPHHGQVRVVLDVIGGEVLEHSAPLVVGVPSSLHCRQDVDSADVSESDQVDRHISDLVSEARERPWHDTMPSARRPVRGR